MRIVLLTPGTGHFYCGSCLRDNTLARALHRRGHDVSIFPLYLPMVTEDGAHAGDPVLMGGIHLYLDHRSALFRHVPRSWTRFLDAPGLLRASARLGEMTDPSRLGPITISTLLGDAGHIARDVDMLVKQLAAHARPDVVLLSNAMLVGVARAVRRGLDCPVVCTLQGEAPFLDRLVEPYREQAWSIVRERVRDCDGWIAVSDYTRDLMSTRLGLPKDEVHTVWNGIEVDDLSPPRSPPAPATIGYLARMCEDKGLPTLVDAYVSLAEQGEVGDARLMVAGVELAEDEPLVKAQRRRLDDAGLLDRTDFFSNVERQHKIELLRGLSVLSVPALYGESFGLYVLEALACGVPVVEPRHGAFPELIEATGGGLLYDPSQPQELVDHLARLLASPQEARSMGEAGRRRVLERFTADHMAAGVERVLDGL